jgi:carbonic anhydrase/acetyltransferase-like protein (isoleucine patch superfamily)
MGSIVMDGAVIGDNCVIGAGSVVTPGKKFECGSLILGSPAKRVRQVKPEETKQKEIMVQKYLRVKNEFLESDNE